MSATGTFEEPVSVDLKLINPSKKRLSFKIKTTAPRAYTVRPNSGVVSPNDKTTVIGQSRYKIHVQAIQCHLFILF